MFRPALSFKFLILLRYFLDPKYAVVIGKPSAALAERLETEEKARIAAQRDSLGPDGLAKREKLLNDAKAEHDKEIPPEVLKSFPVPDVKSISWIPVQSVQQAGQGRTGRTDQAKNQELVQHINADGTELPFFVQYDHVQVTKFLRI